MEEKDNNFKKEKIEACIMLASFLDTIGFKNGEWEFKYGSQAHTISQAINYSYRLVYHFYILGGPSHMSLKKLIASDDTLLFLATTRAVINGGGAQNYINEYLKIFPILKEARRASGYQTLKSLKYLNKLVKKKNKKTIMNDLLVEETMGGNGAAIRTAIIGIRWHNDINKIIEESIIASRLTHNIPLGFLGGLVSAIFTSFAYNDIKPWLWLDKIIEIYENNKIKDYITSTNLYVSNPKIDEEIDNYFYFLYKYKEQRLPKIIKFRREQQFVNPDQNLIVLTEFITDFKKQNKRGDESFNTLGITGIDSIIYAYDALLLSIVPQPDYSIDLSNVIYSYESIIFFGCLHIGDTDSTGAILGAWYGALNGYNGFNKEKMKELEFYKELTDTVLPLINLIIK